MSGTTDTHREHMILADPTSATGLATVSSSGGLLVSLSSHGLTQVIPVTSSGVNLYTTAGINVVSASSGLVQTLSSGPVLLSSGGITQIIPVTSSGVNLYTTAGITVVSASSGLIQTLTSGATVLSSAGITQIIPVTSSGVNLYTTAGITIVSASSGLVQTLSSGAIVLSSAGITQALLVTSSGVNLYSTLGVMVQAQPRAPLQFLSVTVSSSAGKELVAASGSLKVKLVSYVIVASSANEWRWLSSNTALSPGMVLTSGGGIAAVGSMDSWLMETSAGGNLRAGLENDGYVTGHLSYFYEV